MRPTLRPIVLAILAMAGSMAFLGCGGPGVYFTPLDNDIGPTTTDAGVAQYVLHEAGGQSAQVRVAVRGLLARTKTPLTQPDCILATFNITNDLPSPVTFSSGQACVLDNRMVRLGQPQVLSNNLLWAQAALDNPMTLDSGRPKQSLTVKPGQSRSVVLAFSYPPGQSFKNVTSLELDWSAAVAGIPQSFSSPFIRGGSPISPASEIGSGMLDMPAGGGFGGDDFGGGPMGGESFRGREAYRGHESLRGHEGGSSHGGESGHGGGSSHGGGPSHDSGGGGGGHR